MLNYSFIILIQFCASFLCWKFFRSKILLYNLFDILYFIDRLVVCSQALELPESNFLKTLFSLS